MTTRKNSKAVQATNTPDLSTMIAQAVAQALSGKADSPVQLVATNNPQVITASEGKAALQAGLQAILTPVIEAEKGLSTLVHNTSARLITWAHEGLSQGIDKVTMLSTIDLGIGFVNENAVKNSTLKVYLSQLRLVVANADTKLENGKVRELLVTENKKGEPKPASLKGAYDGINKAIKAKAKPLTDAQKEAERNDKLASEFRTLATRTLRDTGLMHEVKKGIKVESVSFEANAFVQVAEVLVNNLLVTLSNEAEKHGAKTQAKSLELLASEVHGFLFE